MITRRIEITPDIAFGGNEPPLFIAGPCVIESREHTLHMAELLRELRDELKINLVFKASFDKANRSSIESFRGDFDPSRYEDTYRDALCEIIRAKRKGEEVHVPERAEEEEPAPDLLSALRASVEAAQGGRGRGRRRSPSNGGDLAKLTKDELYEHAKELDVKGRADMSKDELVEALEAAA